MVSKASTVTSAVSLAAFPALSASFDTGGHEAALCQYRKLHDLICVGMIPLFAAVVIATPPVFSHLFSPAVARGLFFPVLFLCIGTYMNGTLNMPYFFSLAVGKPDIAVKMNLVALMTTTLPAVWLVYEFGLPGAGFSWILYHVSAYAYGIPKFCAECLRLPSRDWLVHVGKIMAVGVVAYGGAWTVIAHYASNYETFDVVIAYLISSGLFLFGSYWIIDSELRGTIKAIAMHVLLPSFGTEVSED
jgi:O-antigen/teichoic acid export membrane protein